MGSFLPRVLFLSGLLALSSGPAWAGFLAAAGKREITPDLKKETIWLAGYGASGRRAQGVHDPLFVRAMVVSDGKKTVALVSVDAIGIYRADVLEMRRALGWTGRDKYLLVAATHDHSAPDTLGLWGRFLGFSGVDERYHKRLKSSVVELVRELEGRLAPAELRAGRKTLDPSGLCRDLRDPVVIDPELDALSLVDPDGKTLATAVRWSCHSEIVDRNNMLVTADYPGALCAEVEAKTKGACAFFPGLVGGLLSPVHGPGMDVDERYKEMEALGTRIAGEALDALAKSPRRVKSGKVDFVSKTVRLRVDNSRYIFFLPALAFGHKLLDAQGRELPWYMKYWYPLRHLIFWPLPKRLRPRVETEVALVRLGPVKLLAIPGELFPELALGGYGGKYRFSHPLVDPENPNPPDLEKAPKGPYIREKMKAEYGFILGLANDEIGYIMPPYDFQVTPNRAMHPRPEGTHYEETNSIGPEAAPALLKTIDELLR